MGILLPVFKQMAGEFLEWTASLQEQEHIQWPVWNILTLKNV